jgi:hypothetical protein
MLQSAMALEGSTAYPPLLHTPFIKPLATVAPRAPLAFLPGGERGIVDAVLL